MQGERESEKEERERERLFDVKCQTNAEMNVRLSPNLMLKLFVSEIEKETTTFKGQSLFGLQNPYLQTLSNILRHP
jgi:hypothetical protein